MDELQKLLSHCINTRDKAIISLVYEGGFRARELLSLDNKHVRLTNDGVETTIPDKRECKTGRREILLTECHHKISEWKKSHPKPEDDNPLFITLERRRKKKTPSTS